MFISYVDNHGDSRSREVLSFQEALLVLRALNQERINPVDRPLEPKQTIFPLIARS